MFFLALALLGMIAFLIFAVWLAVANSGSS